MPSKSRRVAARQTQMTSKRKPKGQSQAPPAPLAPVAAPDATTAASSAQPAPAPQAPTPANAAAARPRGGFRSRGQARAAADATPLTFSYIGPEMRRIGVVTGLIVVVLVVLTFIIR
ncbi:MAG: hypothetical protein Q8O40_12195 [Chloroflexota bacterium]|nr:hypothetical protein [Chloroflexota bacterium]